MCVCVCVCVCFSFFLQKLEFKSTKKMRRLEKKKPKEILMHMNSFFLWNKFLFKSNNFFEEKKKHFKVLEKKLKYIHPLHFFPLFMTSKD